MCQVASSVICTTRGGVGTLPFSLVCATGPFHILWCALCGQHTIVDDYTARYSNGCQDLFNLSRVTAVALAALNSRPCNFEEHLDTIGVQGYGTRWDRVQPCIRAVVGEGTA